jgi:[protein-PII] uridylyltransferase
VRLTLRKHSALASETRLAQSTRVTPRPDGLGLPSAARGGAIGARRSGEPPNDWIDAYIDSMPGGYLRLFDDAAVHLHAAIAWRRAAAPSHIEVCKQHSEGVVAVCIVADDVIGLLSRICAAVLAHDADVVAAQAYGRMRDDLVAEAVDFLWIRRVPNAHGRVDPLGTQEVLRIGMTLDALVRGTPKSQRTVRPARRECDSDRSTVVQFEGDDHCGTVLTVQADDRPGLLLAITRALFGEQVQILSSHVETAGRRAMDRFWVAELDGTPLDRQRQMALRAALLDAIEESTPNSR